MDLDKYRHEIDEIDKNIVLNLHKRFEIVKKVAEFKKKNCIKILDEDREKNIIKQKLKLAQMYDLDASFIEKIYEVIFDESKKIQKELNI